MVDILRGCDAWEFVSSPSLRSFICSRRHSCVSASAVRSETIPKLGFLKKISNFSGASSMVPLVAAKPNAARVKSVSLFAILNLFIFYLGDISDFDRKSRHLVLSTKNVNIVSEALPPWATMVSHASSETPLTA